MNVPKLRFKEFNDEWQNISLNKIVNFSKGNLLSKADLEEEGLYPCVLYGQLYTKYSEVIRTVYSKTNRNDKNLIMSKYGDILIPSSGETPMDISTASCIMLDNILLGGDINILSPKNCDGRFLSYLINNNKRKEIAKLAQGHSVVHLYNDNLRKININIPQLNEQKRIADTLELLDKKIEHQTKKIEDIKLFKKGLLYSIFNKKKTNTNIENCIDYGKAGGTPLSSNKDYYDGNIPFLSISDITNQGKYIFSTEKMISQKGLDNSSAWLIPKNSLILSMYASYGLVAINKIELSTSQAMFNMIINKSNNVEYIYYYLEYLYQNNYYDRLVSTGTQSNLNADKVKKIKIYLPNIEEQNALSKIFICLDKKINFESNKLNKLIKLKKGLIQNMFV
ncbi:MAG: restriction endonuclease subunit S [Bacilli bacterium]|nr:restriction endonuclease subunit S [Bacilli bacterium]